MAFARDELCQKAASLNNFTATPESDNNTSSQSRSQTLVSPGQRNRLVEEEKIDRYNDALNEILDNMDTLLPTIDPLNPENRNTTARLPFRPQVQYLGVMVDAGRHYFPMEWFQQLIPYLHQLHYNMIHLRLTDDQAFSIQLESYPQLAKASAWPKSDEENPVYTRQELQSLVKLAKEYGIVIVPEINVPGHAGAWAGIPNLTVACPQFICEKGYGIPLNIHHPDIKNILKGILSEVVDVFDNPPFLHLGGDEVSMAKACMKEAGSESFQYKPFEEMLQGILQDIGYPEEQVVRWEETPQLQKSTYNKNAPRPTYRAGFIEHYWHDRPGFRTDNRNKVVDFTPPKNPHFVSHKLYMDNNHDSGLSDIYTAAKNNLQLNNGPDYFPTAVVVGTFELDPEMWRSRNVAGRLVAVAMGVAELEINGTDSDEMELFYDDTCRHTLGLHPLICELQGFTAVSYISFGSKWRSMWQTFQLNVCNQMTDLHTEKKWKDLKIHREDALARAGRYMWKTLEGALSKGAAKIEPPKEEESSSTTEAKDSTTTQVGVILDLVNGMKAFNRTADIVENFLAPLNVSLLQLRLVDNHAFAVDLEHLDTVGFTIELQGFARPSLTTVSNVSDLVRLAAQHGMQAFPEISVSTNAGGWAYSGFATKCPQTYCDDAEGSMAADITHEDYLPVVYAAIRELVDVFSVDSQGKEAITTTRSLLGIESAETRHIPYIHLGTDERRSNQKCFQESGLNGPPPYVEFEQNLTRIVEEMVGVPTNKVIRWENAEGVHYPDRTGAITHYPSTNPFQVPRLRYGDSCFVTIDLLTPHTPYDVYKNTRKLMDLNPRAIFAELRRFDEEAWDHLQVELRLTAFHLATRANKGVKHETMDFKKTVQGECRRLGFEQCTHESRMKSMAKWISSHTSNTPLYFYGSEEAREKICGLFAEVTDKRVMKPEMIL